MLDKFFYTKEELLSFVDGRIQHCSVVKELHEKLEEIQEQIESLKEEANSAIESEELRHARNAAHNVKEELAGSVFIEESFDALLSLREKLTKFEPSIHVSTFIALLTEDENEQLVKAVLGLNATLLTQLLVQKNQIRRHLVL